MELGEWKTRNLSKRAQSKENVMEKSFKEESSDIYRVVSN